MYSLRWNVVSSGLFRPLSSRALYRTKRVSYSLSSSSSVLGNQTYFGSDARQVPLGSLFHRHLFLERDGKRNVSLPFGWVHIPTCSYAKKFKKKQSGNKGSKMKANARPVSSVRNQHENKEDKKAKGKQKGASKRGEGIAGSFICNMEGLGKQVGGDRHLFQDVSLSLLQGAKVGILGVNGSGKSSLMKVIAGVDDDHDGTVTVLGENRVGYLPQEPTLNDELNVYQNVIAELFNTTKEDRDLLLRLRVAEMEKNETETEKLIQEVNEKKLHKIRRRVGRAMAALRCAPPLSEVSNLSGGERRRIALCRLLLSEPDLLLLDEPTNHLDTDAVAWLERFLREYRGSVMAVTHDRYFLDNVAGWILELDRGQVHTFRGNYSAWLENKTKRLELEEREQAIRAKVLKKELEWVRRAPKGRQKKSKARVEAYHKMVDEAYRPRPTPSRIVLPIGRRLGNIVTEFKNVSLSFGDRKILHNVSFEVPSGAILGILGANGCGKSTLLSIMRGELQPDEGEVIIGKTVDFGYVSQDRAELDSDDTVYEAIAGYDESPVELGNNQSIDARLYVASFHFRGSDQQKPVGLLSGGERNRVHLAKMLKQGSNVLMLDEPTNDLDVEVLANLENALLDFVGTTIVVSHDRWFLNKVCTHLLIFKGDGELEFYQGSLEDYEAKGGSLSGSNKPRGAGYISLR